MLSSVDFNLVLISSTTLSQFTAPHDVRKARISGRLSKKFCPLSTVFTTKFTSSAQSSSEILINKTKCKILKTYKRPS